jgi:hypothetical protein
MENLAEYISGYHNDLNGNNAIHGEFTLRTNQVPFLKEHRDYIQKNKLGFGDRAFHFMWYLLMTDLKQKRNAFKMIEIGVYKGQVISLWSLLAREMEIHPEIYAISPLKGNIATGRIVNNRVVEKFRQWVVPGFKKLQEEGNAYPKEDYEEIIRSLFNQFKLSFDDIHMFRGYSNDETILASVRKESFDLIYVDGDHTYEGVLLDIRNFSGLLTKGGYLVMDDASWFLEGTKFWKGHKEVSRACEIIEGLGFRNVLNVGHNRIYEKT